ncbi:uncharacterized [Tachysurus ichikawai]
MSNPEVTCSSRLHHNFIPSLNLDGNSGACVVAVNDIIVTLESINHLRLQTSELKINVLLVSARGRERKVSGEERHDDSLAETVAAFSESVERVSRELQRDRQRFCFIHISEIKRKAAT